MILSLDKGFLYIAGGKVASEAFHLFTGHLADAAYSRIPMKKHLRYQVFKKEAEALFGDALPLDELMDMAVVRDPVSWLLSWYNSRARPGLKNPNNPRHFMYTGDIRIEQFLEEAADPNPPRRARVTPQHGFYTGMGLDGKPRCLLALDKLSEQIAELPDVFDHEIARQFQSPRINVSGRKLVQKDDLTQAQQDAICNFLAKDVALYEEALQCRPAEEFAKVDLPRVRASRDKVTEILRTQVDAQSLYLETLLARYVSLLHYGRREQAEEVLQEMFAAFPRPDVEQIVLEQTRRHSLS